MQDKKKKILQFISLKVLLVSVLFVASLFLFALIAREAVLENEKVFDDKVFGFFSSFSTPGFIQVMKVFTFFGSTQFLFPAYVVLISYFFFKKKFRYGIDIAIIGVSSTALMFTLKQIFHRQRPDLPILKGITTYSFPSGHTLSAFIFCSILIVIIRNGTLKSLYKWIVSVLLIFVAITIGASRIALKVHYPTDVIASFCLGVVWVIISLWLLTKINRQYLIKNNLAPAESQN